MGLRALGTPNGRDFAFWVLIVAACQWLVFVRAWRVGIAWDNKVLVVKNVSRVEELPWDELEQVQLGGAPTGRGVWPAPIFRTRSGRVVFGTAFIFMLPRRRKAEVRPLIAEASRHHVPVTVDDLHWRQWRGVAVEADAFRAAFTSAPREITEFVKWMRQRELELVNHPAPNARVYARRSARVRVALEQGAWTVTISHQDFAGWFLPATWEAALDRQTEPRVLTIAEGIAFVQTRLDEAMVLARTPEVEQRLAQIEVRSTPHA